MSVGFVFWLIMLLWLVFGFFVFWPVGYSNYAFGGNILLFILLFLLGWKVFGFPIHG